jgi:hypothetical protein
MTICRINWVAFFLCKMNPIFFHLRKTLQYWEPSEQKVYHLVPKCTIMRR